MVYFFLAIVFFSLLGFAGGGISVFFALEAKRKSVEEGRRQLGDDIARLNAARGEFESYSTHWTADANARLQATQDQFQVQSANWLREQESRWN